MTAADTATVATTLGVSHQFNTQERSPHSTSVDGAGGGLPVCAGVSKDGPNTVTLQHRARHRRDHSLATRGGSTHSCLL